MPVGIFTFLQDKIMKSTSSNRSALLTAGAAVLGVGMMAAVSYSANAQPRNAPPRDHVEVGSLNCDISAGLGVIIGSQRDMQCLFTPADPGRQTAYVGTITRFGLDLGITSGSRMAWAVYAPTERDFRALTGNYVGASAGATVGVGGTVNVLVGGSDRTITLQPISVEGSAGLSVAAGVAELRLRPAR